MKAPGKLRFGYFFIIIVVVVTAASVGLTYFLSNQGILPIGQEGPPGPQGLTGPQGPQGLQGLPGSFSWGTPQSFGPYVLVLDISQTGGKNTPSLNPGDRLLYNFSVSGGNVWYEVRDPYNNKILTPIGNSFVSSGQGAFIAADSGAYLLAFFREADLTSVVTINYTVYPVASK